ncbi:MAG: hypothetical protein ACOCQD_00525 [archaeon]
MKRFPPTAKHKYNIDNYKESTPENTAEIIKSIIPVIDEYNNGLEDVTMLPKFYGWRDYFECSIYSYPYDESPVVEVNEGIFIHNNVLINTTESILLDLMESYDYLYESDNVPSSDGTHYVYTAIKHDRDTDNPDIEIGLITQDKYINDSTIQQVVYPIQVIKLTIDNGEVDDLQEEDILNEDPLNPGIGRGEWYPSEVDGGWMSTPISYGDL